MKNFVKTAGVTLLEVMLVLAIAAMIIVMSVRYYQSTNAANQANTVVQQITSIVSAADSLAQGSGSYAVANVSTATLTPLLPTNGMTAPWGTAITIGGVAASSYTITIPGAPRDVCPLITGKLTANAHFTATSVCAAAGTTNLSTTYLANP